MKFRWKKKAVAKIIIVYAWRYVYRPLSFALTKESCRKSFLRLFFSVLRGRADVSIASRVMYKQFLREIPSLLARHTNTIARARFPMDPFGFFHLFISDKSLARCNFVPREVSSGARATSGSLPLAIVSVQFSLDRHLSLRREASWLSRGRITRCHAIG